MMKFSNSKVWQEPNTYQTAGKLWLGTKHPLRFTRHVTVSRKLAFHNVSKKTYIRMHTQNRKNAFLFSIHNKAQSFYFSSFHSKLSYITPLKHAVI
jgi:hypothetical protein